MLQSYGIVLENYGNIVESAMLKNYDIMIKITA
jgi:hypothetical protein